jgi:hypothetical protein
MEEINKYFSEMMSVTPQLQFAGPDQLELRRV